MAAEHFEGQELGPRGDDPQTFNGVVVVGGPDAVDTREHAEINAPAAARAAFDFDMGVGGAKAAEQGVEVLRLVMPYRSDPRLGREQVTVVIPLEVGNVVFAQQRVDLCKHGFADCRIEQGQHQLAAHRRTLAVLGVEAAEAVRAVEVAVGGDHFRLGP